MSEVQRLANAQGEMELWQPFGFGKFARSVDPTNGFVGAAPGCEWVNTSSGKRFLNAGTSSSAIWIENDQLRGSGTLFGGGASPSTSTAVMLASGNIYRTVLTVANGIAPSATAALKIVDIYTLPANSFDALGRGVQFSVWCNNTGTSGHTVQIQIVANPTNSGLPASGAGVAGQTDGTVTVTGGTAILDTGTSYVPTGTVTFSMQLTGQIFKTATVNKQESLVTNIFPSAGLTHTAAWSDRTLTEANANVFAVCILAATTTTDIVYQGMEITAFN